MAGGEKGAVGSHHALPGVDAWLRQVPTWQGQGQAQLMPGTHKPLQH